MVTQVDGFTSPLNRFLLMIYFEMTPPLDRQWFIQWILY